MIFFQFLSILILIAGVAGILLLEFLNLNKFHPYVTLLAMLGSIGSIFWFILDGATPSFFGLHSADQELSYNTGLLVLDQFTAFFAIVFIGLMLLVVLSSISDLESIDENNRFVYYVLMLFVTMGMILVSSSIDLAALVVSWELVSIPSYLLVAFMKRDRATSEAAIKFFIIGSVSSALMLFGASFLYGIAGSTNIYQILDAVIQITNNSQKLAMTPIIIVGVILVVAGLGFKMGVVPFQWWLPDTYEGAMTSVTAMLAGASKKVGFAAGFRVIMVPLLVFGAAWNKNNPLAQEAVYTFLVIIAMVTMILGNVAALSQTRIKRLLAYSSIGQAGYLMLAIVAAYLPTDGRSIGLAAGLFHSASHGIMTVVAFVCVLAISRIINTDEIESYKGLRQLLPKTSLALTLALLGLAGIPPLIGFFSKFFIFFAAIDAGNNLALLQNPLDVRYLLYLGAFVAIITSAISVYYYVRVVKYMMVDESSDIVSKIDKANTKVPWNISYPMAIATLIIGLSFLAAGGIIDYLFEVAKAAVAIGF